MRGELFVALPEGLQLGRTDRAAGAGTWSRGTWRGCQRRRRDDAGVNAALILAADRAITRDDRELLEPVEAAYRSRPGDALALRRGDREDVDRDEVRVRSRSDAGLASSPAPDPNASPPGRHFHARSVLACNRGLDPQGRRRRLRNNTTVGRVAPAESGGVALAARYRIPGIQGLPPRPALRRTQVVRWRSASFGVNQEGMVI